MYTKIVLLSRKFPHLLLIQAKQNLNMVNSFIPNLYSKNLIFLLTALFIFSNNAFANRILSTNLEPFNFCPETTSITQVGGNTGGLEMGETISICMETNWIPVNVQWIQGVVPVFGDCWDMESFDGASATLNTPSVDGTWNWHEACEVNFNFNVPDQEWGTYTNPINNILTLCNINDTAIPNCQILTEGSCLPAGWYFTGPEGGNPGGDSPNETYGDSGGGGSLVGPFQFCFDISVGNFSDCNLANQNCDMYFKTFSDGEIGDWQGSLPEDCATEASSTANFDLSCCEQPFFEEGLFSFGCETSDFFGYDVSIDLNGDSDIIAYTWTNLNNMETGTYPANSNGDANIYLSISGFAPSYVEFLVEATNGDCTSAPLEIGIQIQPSNLTLVEVEGCDNGDGTFDLTTYDWALSFSTYWLDGNLDPIENPAEWNYGETNTLYLAEENNCGFFTLEMPLIILPLPVVNNITINECISGTIDLTNYNTIVGGTGGSTVTWYQDAFGFIQIDDPTAYAPSGNTVFVNISNEFCETNNQPILLDLSETPTINFSAIETCENGPGTIDLQQYNDEITNGQPYNVFWYEDAQGTVPVADPSSWNYFGNNVYAGFENETCTSEIAEIPFTVIETNTNCNDGVCENGDEYWDFDNCQCEVIEAILGCTNPDAANYNPNASCDDGTCGCIPDGCTNPNACNYDPNATCDDGSCLPEIDCNDNDCITEDVFNAATCECEYTTIPPPNCDDGDCNTDDTYDAATCMCVNTPIPPPNCDDNDCNTVDVYNAATCQCENNPITPDACDDNDCNTVDTYDTVTCECVYTPIPPPNCDDNDCNTEDIYDPAICQCVYTPTPPINCDDNDCNTEDSYDVTTCLCVHIPITPPICDDNNCSTTDSYNPATCECDNIPMPPPDCNDGICDNGVEFWNSQTCNCDVTESVLGCTNPNATNYDPLATCDDGSCTDCPTGPCDDNNECTVEDFYDDNCNCVGIALTCDIGATTTQACDDNNPNTENDMETILDCDGSTCVLCQGTPIDGGMECPTDIDGFTAIGEFNNSKYFISNNPAVPEDLQTLAESNGGYLVTIGDAAENDFIFANINDMVYIGLNDVDIEGTLGWFNGETYSYNNIGVCDFCQSNDDNNDYAVMHQWDGKWSFSNVWNQRLGVIEIPCDDAPVECPCPEIYEPVCANGITYENACFAECEGIFEYTMGACDPNTEICDEPIDGFQFLGNENGSSYYLSNNTAIATEAEQIAIANGGHLVTINSQAENDFVFANINDMVHIGLNDATLEGDLEWTSGQQVDYTNFDICSFCLDNSENDDYVVMHSWNGGWSFSNFWNPRKFVVEIPCLAPRPFVGLETKKAFTIDNVFPNPATDELFIKIKSTDDVNVDLYIYSSTGQVMEIRPIRIEAGSNSIQLNLNEFSTGLYHLQLQDENGNAYYEKFVKI